MTAIDNPGEEGGKYAAGVNKNARLIVRNIPWTATEDALRKHFEPHGEVEEVKLLRRPDGKLVGCGFVHFKQVAMANTALHATNKKVFIGRPIQVAWAVSKDKYVEKLNKNEKDGRKKRKNKVSESDDVGVVEVKEEKGAKESKQEVKKEQVRVNRNARLIVRNVSFKATDETLKENFAPYGDIIEVKLLKKPDGKLVGCAFVAFKNVPMAKKALLNTNMKPFLGRPVSVDWAVAKNKYMQYIDQQQLELQEKVKKEDNSDSEYETKPQNLTGEVKSEPEDSDEDEKPDVGDSDADESGEEEEDDDEEIPDDTSETSAAAERKRIQLNDAEDGRTVFVTDLSFAVDDERLRTFAERTAPVDYALVCVDRLTDHSRGSGFIKFKNAEDAGKFLSLPPEQLKLEGQVMRPRSALTRDHVSKKDTKQAKDSRNLYLVKEGVIVAGTRAAVGVSASDMAKRLALERSKTQMLKNLNRFVSRYRLVVSNLPPGCDDARLRSLCAAAVGKSAVITEARVMRDLRAQVQANGKHPSKGFGFVMFTKTEDALQCLRRLNNNPDIFDKNNRPIVSFSIEDRTALNARKKRLEKSIANNPVARQEDAQRGQYNRKRKHEAPEEASSKRGRFAKGKKQPNRSQPGQFVKRPTDDDTAEYTGLTAKEGSKHNIRSGHKLKAQADVHRQSVKLEKKQSKRALKLKMAAKERIKQPKQKINKNPKKLKGQNPNKVKTFSTQPNPKPNSVKKAPQAKHENFTDLVKKYKTKLVSGNSLEKVKAKWYE